MIPRIPRRLYSVDVAGSSRPPLKVAIVGSGPGGFYTAYRVLQQIPEAMVDMFEALPVPYGLVRYGVAPDHPEVKNVMHKFEEVASDPRFRFIGNTPIGSVSTPAEKEGSSAFSTSLDPTAPPMQKSLPLDVLLRHYNAVDFAYGASQDRALGIPGEDLKGVHSARAFVGWYNGLPQYRDLAPDLSGEEAVIVGVGNVALDVARVLLSPVDVLAKTDISSWAVDALRDSKVKRVRVVGRRGAREASFTIKEVRELLAVPGVGFKSSQPELFTPGSDVKLERPTKRLLDLLAKASAKPPAADAQKTWELELLKSPTQFLPSSADAMKLGAVEMVKNKLEDGRAMATDETVTYEAQLAFRSIGYKSEAIGGMQACGIPFDSRRGIIPNVDGRVTKIGTESDILPGVYASGWVKRGPTGVIASTMYDAFQTADAICSDYAGSKPLLNDSRVGGWDELKKEVPTGLRAVEWEEWKKIDEVETKKGEEKGKYREKFGRVEEMLSVLDG
ncbi:NADPH-adrenodoxin reductase [Saitoella coloradoensis]